MVLGKKLARMSLVLALAAGGAGASFAPRAVALDKGQEAPEIELRDLSGNPVKLSAFRGKVVLVDFWASWCGPCRDSLPVLDRLSRTYQDKGLVVLGVNIDESADAAQAFLKKNNLKVSFPVVNDKDKRVAARYAPPTMPSSFIIDRTGRVQRVHEGFRSSDAQKLEAELKALLQ
jgi:peroxiredoxin